MRAILLQGVHLVHSGPNLGRAMSRFHLDTAASIAKVHGDGLS
jgi:hypothetical protein